MGLNLDNLKALVGGNIYPLYKILHVWVAMGHKLSSPMASFTTYE